ncbi:MAG: RHS repeat-associated core domain-containing protein [Saprospiraceae bacterium]
MQCYRYNGKEKDEATGLYDYGARYYDPAVGRWNAVDPLAELYAPHSPYSYVLNRPMNAVDPDGRLVIFINGFTPNKSDQGSRSYWGSFANGVERHFGEDPSRSLFVHGGNELSRGSRLANGFMTGAEYANQILDMIVDENGYVTETIKVMTHSSGGAFGKGFVKALLKAAKRRGVKGVPITLVADFDPFQAEGLQAEPRFLHNNLLKKEECLKVALWMLLGLQIKDNKERTSRMMMKTNQVIASPHLLIISVN